MQKNRGRKRGCKEEKQGMNGQQEESQEKGTSQEKHRKNVKELLSDETITEATTKAGKFLHQTQIKKHTLASGEHMCSM